MVVDVDVQFLDREWRLTGQVGCKVRRGPSWEWKDQDGGGVGTIVAKDERKGWVKVKWQGGASNSYRMTPSEFDLRIVEWV